MSSMTVPVLDVTNDRYPLLESCVLDVVSGRDRIARRADPDCRRRSLELD